MILIISKNNEITTTAVIKWLRALHKPFIRIHEDEVFEIHTSKKRIVLKSQRNQFFLDEISAVWYRRGGIAFNELRYHNQAIDRYMFEVQHWLTDYVIQTLEEKKHLNKQSNSHVNKLLVLEKAKEAGLDVPEYFLAEDMEDVIAHQTIVKPISGTPIIDDIQENQSGIMYTSLIEQKKESGFFISFFQEKIEKDFEVRSFFLNGKIYSTAIISQNDEKTRIDHRRYNTQTPNRNVRYKLPAEVEQKINVLMQSLDLNSGSLDFIKSGDTFYFLEINAIGQFLGMSNTCNYGLEKEIAAYL
ncbi:grasp-with-spasm system ATP-grasp peptide maturase [Sphingobacterium spiritivorum]|uniref:RimK-like ATP-grasp domain protein n=1 Tax=Sphingobacterium spiritivorum ATCC 33861 TaxID=525373 RepID=D7VNB0_SPHSI|nr:grasp-with-spasm system ATP-grasp peptide maturase [Sphingobacterium spiritivorum]EFK57407.1 RimK-like ATP-grasp domain protein [Sphingobacterium spiritivorum ATCC 33861]QQT36521.1 grasp-with-spasm system ATP-grasp peptide maturase [Sphingobacterium spiritivorum]WQD33272.1 grasp-with-spasm system ATP-grasp peptide maturase [Sphingobacterium spiritivorum]SUJ21559.1 Glutathione synthase/Ribosomal protein S6 modification enzyme (glutaminyl transferase) [Sphingobacterium spiritivorum]